jgi:hypothetical protein
LGALHFLAGNLYAPWLLPKKKTLKARVRGVSKKLHVMKFACLLVLLSRSRPHWERAGKKTLKRKLAIMELNSWCLVRIWKLLNPHRPRSRALSFYNTLQDKPVCPGSCLMYHLLAPLCHILTCFFTNIICLLYFRVVNG